MLLTDVKGRKFLTGTDEQGNIWNQFEIDYLNDPTTETCMECNRPLEFGWRSMQDETVCDDEVNYEGARPYFFPEEIEKATEILQDKLYQWWK